MKEHIYLACRRDANVTWLYNHWHGTLVSDDGLNEHGLQLTSSNFTSLKLATEIHGTLPPPST